MNELKNIINLFEDCDLDIYVSVDCDYAETDIASFECISEFTDVYQMLHENYCTYINEDEDLVIFDKEGLEYIGYWR